jgi:hypothetical protein
VSIPNVSASSKKLIRYANYHVAALSVNPVTAHLATALEEEIESVEAAEQASQEAAKNVARASALFDAADAELDLAVRRCHQSVLRALEKNEASKEYKACFPKGLSAMVAGRGERQEKQVEALLSALTRHLPTIASAHAAPLSRALEASQARNGEYKVAQRAMGNAGVNEKVARAVLIEQLHKNRGALRVVHPEDPKRVTSYFPPSRRDEMPDSVQGESAVDSSK